ncbi:MAG: thiamine-binding protein [Bacteroidetes bacterium]|nr:thiamine-binding protein [Bacteroidota bacterium]
MSKANLSLQLIPVNTTEAYPVIDEAIRVIQKSGLRYEVQPFSTVVEGTFPELLQLIQDVKEAALEAGGEELILNMQIHLKKGKDVVFEDKTGKFDKS